MRRAGDRAVNTGEPTSAVLVPAPDFRRLIVPWIGHSFDSGLDSVIPEWSEGPDLRCTIAHRGILGFRVRSFPSPGMTVSGSDGTWDTATIFCGGCAAASGKHLY